MAGEAILHTYTTVYSVIDGGAVASAAFSVAADIDNDVDNTTNRAPLCNIIITVQYDSAPTAGQTIDVYRRDLNVVGSNDEPEPDANYKHRYVGSVVLDAVTTTQYLQLTGVPLPPTGCQFYIYNGSSTGIGAGDWDLDVQPYTMKAAA